jgi:hypothetical protein
MGIIMKKLSFIGLFLAAISANAESEVQLQKLALNGDYQAQRNLAYGYVHKEPVKACGWYRVILITQASKIQQGDFSNEWTYCSKLSLADSMAAWKLAKEISN